MTGIRGYLEWRRVLASRGNRDAELVPYPLYSSSAVESVIGILVVGVVLTSGGLGFASHIVCSTDYIVDQNFWTPFDLTNAPYGGYTHWGAVFDNWGLFGPAHVVLSDGNLSDGNLSTGYFETQNWSVYSQGNLTAWGPGVNTPCTSAYSVKLAHSTFDVSADGPPLQGPGNTSNVNEPTDYSPDGRPTAVFANGFMQSNMPAVSTCGKPTQTLNVTSQSFDVTAMFQTIHGPVSVTFPIQSLETFSYYFPANGGTWQVDNLSAPGGPGGGWAFSYSPCP